MSNLTREPVAEAFYRGDCSKQVDQFLEGFEPPGEPAKPVAGVVPHAGWVFSGGVAAKVFASLRAVSPEAFVLFGSVHRSGARTGAVYDTGEWSTPLGAVRVDTELATHLIERSEGLLIRDPGSHAGEHSIEVQLPMIKHLFPDAGIVPVAVTPCSAAAAVGKAVGAALMTWQTPVAVVGSSDLTHYGRNYDFAPWGTGAAARREMEANDRRVIDKMLALKADEIVAETEERSNACGGGAIAATLAAARALGADKAALIEYTTSHDVTGDSAKSFDTAVGYAGAVFGN
jgi:hypothetical protein